MNYCIYLKKRKNKPYCKLAKEEITLSQCQGCVNKQYKDNISKKKNPHMSGKMKIKSNKLAKLERNRFSVFTENLAECIVCKSTYQLTWHEIFAGRNRKNSMEDGFCLRMCLKCHEEKQENTDFNDFWHRQAQLYFENNIGSRNDFLARYRRNYLD